MIKIIKSNRIFLKLPKELAASFEQMYTFNIYTHPGQKFPTTVKQIFKISEDVYQLERGALPHVEKVLKDKGYEYTIIDRTISNKVEYPPLIGKARQDQHDAVMGILKENGGIINGAPSYGKTFSAIYMAQLIGEKTLVVCTTTSIRDNWVSEIKKFLGITPGIIGGGKMNLDSPIVVGNIQSVTKFATEISKEFGLLVIDEMHHTPASTFSKVVTSSHAKYRLGLSGTLKRKDGLQVVFQGLFSANIVIPPERNRLKPVILRIPLEEVELSGNNAVPWANKISAIYDNPLYIDTILKSIGMLLAAGYVTLFTSDRVAMLERVAEEFNGALFSGSIDTVEREKILEKVKNGTVNLVSGSQSIFAEGVSCEPLSALIMSGSSNNESLIEQTIGRIQRLLEGKKQPISLDICLGGALGKKHARERKSLYLVKGWKIIECNTIEALADAIILCSTTEPESV